MKSVIYEFDPVIYPVRLWVSKKPATDDVSGLFYPHDNDGNMVDDFGSVFTRPGIYANTVIVSKKSSFIRGCFVAVLLPSNCGSGVCSHEALHFIAYCSELFDIPLGGFDKSEPLAYLEQWATNCIESVIRGVPGKMKGVLIE